MARRLGVAALVALVLVAADVFYWGWLLGSRPEDADLPHWQDVFDTIAFFGGAALFVFALLVILGDLGLKAFRAGRRSSRRR